MIEWMLDAFVRNLNLRCIVLWVLHDAACSPDTASLVYWFFSARHASSVIRDLIFSCEAV